MDKQDQIEDDEDDLERAISEEEDRHENEVKDIQGKIFKENQYPLTQNKLLEWLLMTPLREQERLYRKTFYMLLSTCFSDENFHG